VPLLARDELRPAQRVLQAQRAGAPRVGVQVVEADEHHRRDELGRRVAQQGPLREAEVRRAVRRQPPVEPRLLAQPGNGVLPVVALVGEGLEDVARAPRPPAALHHHVEATLGQQAPVDQRRRQPPLVRPPHQHRAAARPGGRVVLAREDHPVAHGDLDRRDRVVGRRARQPHRPAGHAIDQPPGAVRGRAVPALTRTLPRLAGRVGR
jgi:hypothetical protein